MATPSMAPPPPVPPAAPPPPMPRAAPSPMALLPRAPQAMVPHWAPPATAPPAVAPPAMAPLSMAPPAPWLQAEPSPVASMLGAHSSTGDLAHKGMAFYQEKLSSQSDLESILLPGPNVSIDKTEHFYMNSRDFTSPENNGTTLQEPAGGFFGSFQQLLWTATSGALYSCAPLYDLTACVPGPIEFAYHENCGQEEDGDGGTKEVLPAQDDDGYFDGQEEDSPSKENGSSLNSKVLPAQDDDGYLGGQEEEDERFGQDEDPPSKENGSGLNSEVLPAQDDDGYFGGQEEDESYGQEEDSPSKQTASGLNSPMQDDDNVPNGLDVDSDLEDAIDEGNGGTGCASLGDCGCVTSGEPEGDESDGAGDIDSEDSDDEDYVEVPPQEIYVDKTQLGVPYKKRKRAPKNDNRPNCRPPRMMGAVERALRSAKTRDTEFIFEPIMGMVFDSRQEAREFYNMYSWEVGFGVKYNTSRPGSTRAQRSAVSDGEDDEPYRSMQEIVCQRNGSDDRTTHGTKRCGCPAKIRLLRTDDHGWYIAFHEKKHNHELSKTCGEKREWNSHRQIEPHVKEMIKQLRSHDMNLTKVHSVLGDMYGNMGDVPWTRRSLRTVCNQIAREQMDDDIKKTMEIFRQMHEKDPGFQFSLELDKRSRIRSLLWCSGRGREQYECFGDVVTFDTTYCTNIYKMPFGLFVGVNNHFQTTIFGGVLMRRETAKSFKWVFKEFLNLMGGKAPLTILTDQCKAMTKAIRIVMPDTYHLWCKWHVMKKIRECLGPLYTKNKKFRNQFWLVVNGMLTEDEFESAWADLVKTNKLEENAFIKRIYNCRKKWAKPWSKDKFCARMSSTQRSESANFLLKRFVPRNSSMNHFVSQYSKLLYERDREEDIAEDKTKQLNMVHSRLWAIERHALSIYTKAVFELFRAEVDKCSNYVVDKPNGNVHTVSHDTAHKRAHWQRVHFKVEVLDGGQRYVCECGLYEHFGILCCHSIRVMLQENIAVIPDAHIMKRWTRNARDVLPAQLQTYQKDLEAMHSMTFRHRLLRDQSEKLVATGDIDVEMFEIAMKHMKNAEKEAAEVLSARAKNAEVLQDEDSSDEEVECEVQEVQPEGGGAQSDGEVLRRQKYGPSGGTPLQRKNKYGASGSSAHFSDTDIINVKAPVLKKVGGRPRGKRFVAGSESSKRKWKKKSSNKKYRLEKDSGNSLAELVARCDNNDEGLGDKEKNGIATGGQKSRKNTKKTKRVIKCGRCGLEGHNAIQCCSIEITDATAGAYL